MSHLLIFQVIHQKFLENCSSEYKYLLCMILAVKVFLFVNLGTKGTKNWTSYFL